MISLNPNQKTYLKMLARASKALKNPSNQMIQVYDPRTQRLFNLRREYAIRVLRSQLRNPLISFSLKEAGKAAQSLGDNPFIRWQTLTAGSDEDFLKKFVENTRDFDQAVQQSEKPDQNSDKDNPSAKPPSKPIKEIQKTEVSENKPPEQSNIPTQPISAASATPVQTQSIVNPPQSVAAKSSRFQQMRSLVREVPRFVVRQSFPAKVGNAIGSWAARNKGAAQSILIGAAVGGVAVFAPGASLSTVALATAAGAIAPHARKLGIINALANVVSGAVSTGENFLREQPNPETNDESPNSDGGQSDQSGSGRRGSQGGGGGRRRGSAPSRPNRGQGNPGSFLNALRKRSTLTIILLLIAVAIAVGIFQALTGSPGSGQNSSSDSNPSLLSADNLDIKKIGPDAVGNGEDILYKITVTYKGKGTANIKVLDQLPSFSIFKDTESKTLGAITCKTTLPGNTKAGSTGQIIEWTLTSVVAGSTTELCLTITPQKSDFWVQNNISATIGEVFGAEGDKLKVDISAPTGVPNTDSEIKYPIIVTYTGTGTATIEISDLIPENTEFVSGSQKENCESQAEPTGGGPNDKKTVVWGPFELTQGQSAKVCLTIKPLIDKIKISNQAIAKVIKLVSPASNPGATDFESIVKGQGRNIQILGSEDDFIKTVLRNGSKYSLADKEPMLRELYRQSSSSNVNPLAVLTIWGVEQGFRINGSEFGCKPFGTGFNNQMSCSIRGTINFWMNEFEKNNKNGSYTIQGTACTYTDAFTFMYEKYSPVCQVYDKNENARNNFYKFYKELGGF